MTTSHASPAPVGLALSGMGLVGEEVVGRSSRPASPTSPRQGASSPSPSTTTIHLPAPAKQQATGHASRLPRAASRTGEGSHSSSPSSAARVEEAELDDIVPEMGVRSGAFHPATLGGTPTQSESNSNSAASSALRGTRSTPSTPLTCPPTPSAVRFSRAVVEVVADTRASHDISLWSHPLTIALALVRYLRDGSRTLVGVLWRRRRSVSALLLFLSACVGLYLADGAHQSLVLTLETWTLWYGWWVVLGIASSIGLGTGLHTFILFLAPLVAKTTMTAYTCGTLDFAIRGPHAFECAAVDAAAAALTAGAAEAAGKVSVTSISIWSIFRKVRLATMFWGFGTTLGELPPYFVAKAAYLTGKKDSSYQSVESLLHANPSKTLMQELQSFIHFLVQRVGFWGILLCASIPNPLFDVAGILCGHFGVPLHVFFGATLIGKTLIKCNVQVLVVILLFSQDAQHVLLEWMRMRSPLLHGRVASWVEEGAAKLHPRPAGAPSAAAPDQQTMSTLAYLGAVWNALLACMVLYYLFRVLEALALLQLRKEAKARQARPKGSANLHRRLLATSTKTGTGLSASGAAGRLSLSADVAGARGRRT